MAALDQRDLIVSLTIFNNNLTILSILSSIYPTQGIVSLDVSPNELAATAGKDTMLLRK
jgi:hypothetical protein